MNNLDLFLLPDTNIYAYFLSNYHPESAKRIGVCKEELTELERRKLTDLKKWIYKQQISRVKALQLRLPSRLSVAIFVFHTSSTSPLVDVLDLTYIV